MAPKGSVHNTRGRGSGSCYGPIRRDPGPLLQEPIRSRSREEAKDFDTERNDDKLTYLSDVSGYIGPVNYDDSDDDTDQTNWAKKRLAHFSQLLPGQTWDVTCRWYSKVLKESTFLPDRLREYFSMQDVDTNWYR